MAISDLKKLKRELSKISINKIQYISDEDIKEICNNLSREAAADVEANYKNNTLNYKGMQTSTLIELSEYTIIAGTGEDTVIIIDDIK